MIVKICSWFSAACFFSNVLFQTVNDVSLVFSQLNVGALLVKGKVSQLLLDRCYGSGIVTVTSVPYLCLVALAASTSAALCTYVTESTQVGFDSLH